MSLKKVRHSHTLQHSVDLALSDATPNPALRLFSPVSSNSRSSNKETVLPRGGGKDGKQPILVPKGTSVRWTSHGMHRNKDVFGPDADEFRPERWESDLRVG